MAVGDAYVFPGFLTPVLTQLFFPKPPTTFLTCFCRGERRKYTGKKSRLNRGSNSQPPGHESDTLTTEPPGRGHVPDEQAKEALLIVRDDSVGSDEATARPSSVSKQHVLLNFLNLFLDLCVIIKA